MFDSSPLQFMHLLSNGLLYPVILSLLGITALALWESGLAVGERFGGLTQMRKQTITLIENRARRRIERADLIARIGPMLGLMGTLIPLGPGLAGLGRGELDTLATAVTVAFDTTVLGLFVGIMGFVIGRLRRRWYDHLLNELEGHAA